MHIERQNLDIRIAVRRLTRLTYAFSKKWENHRAALALDFAYYNLCLVHGTTKVTPAMAAGLADRRWTLADLMAAWFGRISIRYQRHATIWPGGITSMASTSEVQDLPDERCPDCGSGFARDLKGIGYRRHLERLPKRDSRGRIIRDAEGNPVMCGGTSRCWGRGHRS